MVIQSMTATAARSSQVVAIMAVPIGAITTEGEPLAPIIVGVARAAAIGLRARAVPIDRQVTQAPIVAALRVVAIDLPVMQALIRPQTGRAASEHAAGGEGIEPVATTTTVLITERFAGSCLSHWPRWTGAPVRPGAMRGAFDIVDSPPAHHIDTPAFYLCA
jgi:hypothetical protein